jgi:hypothetical protein
LCRVGPKVVREVAESAKSRKVAREVAREVARNLRKVLIQPKILPSPSRILRISPNSRQTGQHLQLPTNSLTMRPRRRATRRQCALLNGLAHGFWVYFVDKSITFWAKMCRFGPKCAALGQNVPLCALLCRFVLFCAKMCHFVLFCAVLCSFVPSCAKMCQVGPKCAVLCSFVPFCAVLCYFVPSWAKKFAILAERFIDPLLYI